MVTFEQAKIIYHGIFPHVRITAAYDLGDAYVISGLPKDASSFTGCGLIREINKTTGKHKPFMLPNEVNFERLDKGISLL